MINKELRNRILEFRRILNCAGAPEAGRRLVLSKDFGFNNSSRLFGFDVLVVSGENICEMVIM